MSKAKERASFAIRPELKRAFEKEADKEVRTLSYYIERICEDFATRNKLKVK
jgi:hypothetical protein